MFKFIKELILEIKWVIFLPFDLMITLSNDSQKKFVILGPIAFMLWLSDNPPWIHHPLGFIWVFSLVAYLNAGWNIYIVKKKD